MCVCVCVFQLFVVCLKICASYINAFVLFSVYVGIGFMD